MGQEDNGPAARVVRVQGAARVGYHRARRMRYFTFEIVVEKEPEDAGFLAYSPTLPGCFSNGATIDEARRNMREAIRQHVEALLAHGDPVPQADKRVHVEELTVGVP